MELSPRDWSSNPYFDKFIIHEALHWAVYVSERGGCNLGRMYFWLKRNGIVHPWDLSPAEDAELKLLAATFWKAVQSAFQADHPNFAYLANEEVHGHHCHYHLVPRYRQPRTFQEVRFYDMNWGRPWHSETMRDNLVRAVGAEIMRHVDQVVLARK
jgi:diadenosine tetraphosphate (Ap4A) HIT family hydrolase